MLPMAWIACLYQQHHAGSMGNIPAPVLPYSHRPARSSAYRTTYVLSPKIKNKMINIYDTTVVL